VLTLQSLLLTPLGYVTSHPAPTTLLSNSVCVAGTRQGFVHWSSRFKEGFTAAFAMMIVSEIGDKTFFIAAIMAMK
jgi:hypothetical protein